MAKTMSVEDVMAPVVDIKNLAITHFQNDLKSRGVTEKIRIVKLLAEELKDMNSWDEDYVVTGDGIKLQI